MYGGYGGMGGLGGMGGMGGLGMGMGGMGMSGYGGMGGMGMGGYGMGGGMYGSSGMYGGSSGMYGGGYGTGGMGTLGMSGGGRMLGGDNTMSNGLVASPDGQLQQQQGSLLPADPNQAASPIHQHASPLPPLNETTEEKGRRVRAEHRKERQLIKQQREQRKQIRMQARMEIAGHLTNVLVQTLRSTMEMFAVCFGTYYSMKAVRAFANSQESMSQNMTQFRRGPMGQMTPTGNGNSAIATAAVSTAKAAAGKEAAKPSRWRVWLLFGALFLLGEVVYTTIARARESRRPKLLRSHRRQQVVEDEFGNIITHDEMDEGETASDDSQDAMSLYTTDSEGTMASVYRSNAVSADGSSAPLRRGTARNGRGSRRLFVAAYDHEAAQPGGGYLSFKAGDEFVVEDYVEGSWCEAIPVTGGREKGERALTSIRGLVPSNFLRPLENSMLKL